MPKKPPPHEARLGSVVVSSTAGERVEAFLPSPLPPNPPVRMDQLSLQLEAASQAMGRLEGVASILPSTPIFLYMYIRKEALLSSQIEGTQSSLSELLLFENEAAPGAPLDDVQEVSNYVAAISLGLKRIKEDFPISLRLMRELHGVLLAKGRGSRMQPGEFRRSQNWIGGTRPGNARYVPPPQDKVLDLMSELEAFINKDTPDIPILIKAGLVHVQFETIHPFLDGNGRLGRLLITLLLCSHGVLTEPSLYLSLHFKQHRQRYYELLQQVRKEGDWEAWLVFFLEGVAETSNQAVATARELLDLFATEQSKIEGIGRPAASALRVHQLLQQKPIIAVPSAAKQLGVSVPTVARSIQHLERLGIVREFTGKRRGRMYIHDRHMKILERGTE